MKKYISIITILLLVFYLGYIFAKPQTINNPLTSEAKYDQHFFLSSSKQLAYDELVESAENDYKTAKSNVEKENASKQNAEKFKQFKIDTFNYNVQNFNEILTLISNDKRNKAWENPEYVDVFGLFATHVENNRFSEAMTLVVKLNDIANYQIALTGDFEGGLYST